jgi:dTDP-4-amino-4,6-dideoxygalactose transaminase
MIPSVDLRAQYRQIKPGLNEAIAGVIESWKFVLADEVVAFEEEFARYFGAKYAQRAAAKVLSLPMFAEFTADHRRQLLTRSFTQ